MQDEGLLHMAASMAQLARDGGASGYAVAGVIEALLAMIDAQSTDLQHWRARALNAEARLNTEDRPGQGGSGTVMRSTTIGD